MKKGYTRMRVLPSADTIAAMPDGKMPSLWLRTSFVNERVLGPGSPRGGDATVSMADIGHDVESAVFTISDLGYHKDFISRYGLLKTNPDNSIIKVKTAYYVAQNVASVFNDSVERIPDYRLDIQCEKKLNWCAFRAKTTGLHLVAFWDGTAVPSNDFNTIKAQLVVAGGSFREPVWVDMLTGNVDAIPNEQITVDGETYTFKDILVYDGPCVIMDKRLLTFVPARRRK